MDNGIYFCESKKFDYKIYSEVVSGGKVDREEFNKLIEDCKNKNIDGVWVFKYDRL